MRWIGLTGGIASGKTAAHQVVESLGYPVIDADQLARQVVAAGMPGLVAVAKAFGENVIDAQGELDRRKLGEIVFSNPDHLSLLEKILHPLIQEECAKQKEALSEQSFAVAFYVVPLLFEKNLQDQFDQTVLVWCDEETQLKRLMLREGLSREQALERIDFQWSAEEKKDLADVAIENNGTLDELKNKVKEYCRSIPSPR